MARKRKPKRKKDWTLLDQMNYVKKLLGQVYSELEAIRDSVGVALDEGLDPAISMEEKRLKRGQNQKK